MTEKSEKTKHKHRSGLTDEEKNAIASQHAEMEEHMAFRNYMRDLVLGANDGLVSIFALVIGVAGGGQLPSIILLAGIAGAVAGAISMAIGEYISTKSQEEVYDAEERLEKQHIKDHRGHEQDELYEFYEKKGFEGPILDEIVETISSDDKVFLKEMMMAEFGVLEAERRSPITATIVVGIAFLFGSLLPVIPFFTVPETLSGSTSGIVWSGILSGIGLFTVGAIKSWITRSSIYRGGGENFALGMIGAAITYLVGFLIGTGL